MSLIEKNKIRNLIILSPVFGCFAFIILYIIATIYYPGGSKANNVSKGFSWVHNYWCNLLNEKAINGALNTGRSYAISAMICICISLAIFWYYIPEKFNYSLPGKKIAQFCGISSMVIALFLFSQYHDMIINLAGALSIIALVLTQIGLYKKNNYLLFITACFNLLLILINSYIYYTGNLLLYLPLIQKISFLFFLAWICMTTITVYNLNRIKLPQKSVD
jgi:hypothetical protein